MQKPINRRQTLLSRWTFRYVLTLFIGLIIIGLISIVWIREGTLNKRKQNLETFAQAAVQYVNDNTGKIAIPKDFYEWIDLTQRRYLLPGQFSLSVFDARGVAIFVKSAPQTGNTNSLTHSNTASLLNEQSSVTSSDGLYTLKIPVLDNKIVIGSLVISYSYQELAHINQNYALIASLLFSSGLLGWLIIFFLSRNLRKPIKQLAEALNQMEAGQYQVVVPGQVKEKEIHDLLCSFQKMAARLGLLEELRTELLAGVTHELKTPIASIHGLIHAVRDQVVTGSEAEEFLDISLQQTRRLQHMVTDLLDFNAFASGKINVRHDSLDLCKLVGEIVYQWGLIDPTEWLEVSADIPEQSAIAVGDASRIQQIIVNLLNNSRQALGDEGSIRVHLAQHSDTSYEIKVKDNGPGIPEDEQRNIFERYFRGKRKKHTVSGLGLGLTYSQMLAAAMGGQLILKESSPQEGTTFQLLLPKQP
ncbi:HAMP domain-containing sensor histidine kinase [Paenibacillus luteus]|uniref:HAMP domain-containing sensor histidine kinase n=1 Tax=Paenibacillus luteus TaxID=2545753 RepID=UPI0011413E7A|nr:HAMP domain-containing sensor histidine kinase [Paenibacillus luteus]